MLTDDELAKLLMARVQCMQIIVIEEMTEGSMADVMDERGDTKEFLDVVGRRCVGSHPSQKRIQVPREAAGHMHGTDGMHEARMFGGGIHPTGALELINLPEALDPGGIDQILFGPLVWIRLTRGDGEGHVLVNGIRDEGRTLIGSIGSASGCMPCHRRGSILT